MDPIPHACVTIIQENIPAYRVPFFKTLHHFLSLRGIQLRIIYSLGDEANWMGIQWVRRKPIRSIGPFRWQRVSRETLRSDLVIAPQEVKYLTHPWIMLWFFWFRHRFAFWGHGKNFQAANPHSLAEKWKRYLSCRADWWFVYNMLSARVVKGFGLPQDRITVVGNSVDTRSVLQFTSHVSSSQKRALRKNLGISGSSVAIFSGRFYHHKRIPFLLEACRLVRATIPDFELLILGSGPEIHTVREAAACHPWIHYWGPLYDRRAALCWSLAKLSLMPGLVGLGVVDSFAYGVPMITTNYPFHSPEIDYLQHRHNGWIVANWTDPAEYAKVIVRLLKQDAQRQTLVRGCRASLPYFSTEKMAARFARGILRCLATPPSHPNHFVSIAKA